jgi:hypothetical protein
MVLNEKIKILEEAKNELKKELQNINKKLRHAKCNEYQKREENLKYCDCCDKKISKYTFDKHIKTEGHKLRFKIKNNDEKKE